MHKSYAYPVSEVKNRVCNHLDPQPMNKFAESDGRGSRSGVAETGLGYAVVAGPDMLRQAESIECSILARALPRREVSACELPSGLTPNPPEHPPQQIKLAYFWCLHGRGLDDLFHLIDEPRGPFAGVGDEFAVVELRDDSEGRGVPPSFRDSSRRIFHSEEIAHRSDVVSTRPRRVDQL